MIIFVFNVSCSVDNIVVMLNSDNVVTFDYCLILNEEFVLLYVKT